MNDIILPGTGNEGFVFDLKALVAHLEQVQDERKARGKRYRLSGLLAMVILAKLAGEQKPTAIAEWLQLR